jgi:amino acid adenylation domain-containing protein
VAYISVSESANNDSLPEGIVTDPNHVLAKIPLLTAAEKYQLLVEWNDTRIAYPSDKCIHELFEIQAAKTPDAIAVVLADQHLTYQELNNRANQLAHYLRKLGVGPETLVGICMERSMETMVGLFGILKAGGAYVPLDPTYPKERLAFMLEDSQAPFLLTQARLDELLPAYSGTSITLDQDCQDIAQESTANVGPVQGPENLAYVIYTSGSTGKPKGVMIQHRSVVNFLASMARQPGLCETDIVLAVTNLSFDMAGFDFYLPLTVGARMVLARREDVADGLRLKNLLPDSGATVMQATPATWRMLLAAGWQGSGALKILCGGEALSEDLAKQLGQHCVSLWNMYGPTEATVTSSAELYCLQASGRTVPIGRPIANTQIYILDQQSEPVPIGVPGELHIGGDGLARGYLNRPELTAEKFIANPFDADNPRRLYKTGDLARYQPDGKIEFLGRMDHQVKIRGYRIELGEIEAVLARHRSIKESVVVARDDSLGSQRLVAYVVADATSVPSANELRGFLQQTLPEYMVPAAFEFLDSLPLTPNGKLDRKALPTPGKGRPRLDEAYTPPQTPVEELLAHVWAEVLMLDQVGIHDNFFALGGDSLRAIQVIARLRKVLNKELFLSDIFSNGTIAELAKSLTERIDKANALVAESIQPVGRNRRLPLSFSQERVWFLQQLYPSNRAYHFQSLLYFTGSLDVDALELSLGEIVRRHEIFRTTFREIDGDPIQDVHPPFSVSLPVVNLQEMPDQEREAVLQKRITEETQKLFELNTLPLVRWTLVQLKVDEFVLIHVEHHLVHDGWSFNVFRRELLEIYKTFSAGEASPLPEPTLQFADFALWQRRWMEGETAKRQLAYWQRQLRGSPSALALPTDHARPPVPSFRGAAPRYAICRVLGESLRALSRERGATVFMTMFAVFVALLYRYTQQEDILVGTGVGNRRWKETEGLIGMVVNNAVLRTNLAENPKFIDLLDQVKCVALEAYANEDIPFDQVVRALNLKRDDSRNPIFQVMFSFHDAPLREPSLPEVDFKCVEVISNQSAKFDLNVVVIPRREQDPSSFTLNWEYSADLFEPDTIERMVGHYFRLLEEIIADPCKRISDLPILTETEKHQLLVEWNKTERDYPKDKCIQELFEAQVEKTPDAVAVIFEEQQLTYRELNQRANQLAHYLQKLGVGPEVLVGICMQRSLELIVGLLGILKAGGAYVPLDPGYPKERLSFMLTDTQAPVLLTQQELLGQLSHYDGRVVCLDRDGETISTLPHTDTPCRATAENLACVLYTSGSTGKPKGVAVRQCGVIRLMCKPNYVVLSPQETVGQVSNVAFDAATFEIWGALLNGGRLAIITQDTVLAPEAFVAALERHRITCLFLTTALFNTISLAMPEAFRGVRQLLFGGEACDPERVRAVLETGAPETLIHVYGPTETTTFATFYPVKGVRRGDRTIPIGRPIANTQIYILDRQLRPVPVGVVGELHIGGDGIARGYLNRPELTKEKFIANPFSADPRSRLYKTGDSARYLPDGNIEFLGRMDNQVKIRGYRIELGEIESVLDQHPAIQSSVVAVREDAPGDKQLVGYVVPRTGGSFDVVEARKYLKEKLPEYMLPSAFVTLNELPLTPNGKIDRRALPAPDQNRATWKDVYHPPRTPIEETLAGIWAELLKLDKVGIHDNFFDLGGHSLLATQVISRMRNAFSIEVPLRQLFDAPTIAEMATFITENQGKGAPEVPRRYFSTASSNLPWERSRLPNSK